MHSRTPISFAALAGFVALAFGSGSLASLDDLGDGSGISGVGMPSGHAANEPACRKYVENYNALDCMGDSKLDPDAICGSVGMTTTDMTGYYECMAEGYKCVDGLPNAEAATKCELPSM